MNAKIDLTETAMAMAKNLKAENPEWQSLDLRLYLDGKGCDGFFYGVSFDSCTEDDLEFAQGDIRVIVDRDTITYVAGSEIDWVDDERGRGFLVNNPHHQKFRGKFFKRKIWKDKLTQKQNDQ